jgi:hypothetical protein
MTPLETTAEIHDVLSMSDATIAGVLIAIAISFGFVIRYLFKTNQELSETYMAKFESLNKEFVAELKANNEALLKVNSFQNEFVNNMVALNGRK